MDDMDIATDGNDGTTGSGSNDEASAFADAASDQAPGLLAELWDFLKHNKKWWLTPIIVVLLLMAALLMLGGTAAAPFIYTLF